MGMDEAGAKVIAHFNRRGDVDGQRLFYLYTVEVEKMLKEKQILTVNRNPLPDHGKSKLDRPKRNEKLADVVDNHHVSESNARFAAKRALVLLRSMEHAQFRELIHDKAYLMGLAKAYKVKTDHVPLFVEMVEAGAKQL